MHWTDSLFVRTLSVTVRNDVYNREKQLRHQTCDVSELFGWDYSVAGPVCL